MAISDLSLSVSVDMAGATQEEEGAFAAWASARLVEQRDLLSERAGAFIDFVMDQERIRALLRLECWVAFVSEGSVLVDGIAEAAAVPFVSPAEHRRELLLLPCSRRRVLGMAVPAGVTVVVGGGYHG